MSDHSGESGRRANAQRIIELIRREFEKVGTHLPEDGPPRNLSWDDPDDRALVREKFENASDLEAILPGFGEDGLGSNAREDCGDPHPFVCHDCGNQVDFGRTCSMSVCSRCGVAWVRDAAIAKSAKIRRVRKTKHQNTPDGEHQKEHHQVINAPLDWYYSLARDGYTLEEAQEKTREVVKDILDEMRAQGLLVRHSYRGARDDGAIRSENDDRGAWKERLNSGRKWVGDVRDDLAWKPHYHAVVVSDFLKGDGFTDEIEHATGWVIHRIAGDDGVSIPTDGAMARVVSYTLSHADIMVREQNNRSAVWEVGSFYGDLGDDGGPIKSTPAFSPRPSDKDWADAVVRRVAQETLGLRSGTTDCGAELPAVDDPDELARRVLEDLYPDEDTSDVPEDAVLYHISEGNISVSVSSTSGGGGSVSVRDAFGEPISAGGFSGTAGDLPTAPSGAVTADGGAESITPLDDVDDDCECDDHDDDQDDTCDGQLIPLEEARHRGLLDDDDWVLEAAFSEEALEADREWPDDLEPWKSSSSGKSIGVD